MTTTFLNTSEDMQWLRETALKDHASLHSVALALSVMIYGNEDSPYKVELYQDTDPLYTDKPYTINLGEAY
jgi:hypothetical protein